jgi:hypothetical protein
MIGDVSAVRYLYPDKVMRVDSQWGMICSAPDFSGGRYRYQRVILLKWAPRLLRAAEIGVPGGTPYGVVPGSPPDRRMGCSSRPEEHLPAGSLAIHTPLNNVPSGREHRAQVSNQGSEQSRPPAAQRVRGQLVGA